jgi:hypothetical protein
MSIGHDGYPGATNYDGEPVPQDAVDDTVADDTVAEPGYPTREVPTPRTPEDDYVIPEKKKGISRRGALAAIGAVAVAGVTAAVVFIGGGGGDKDSSQTPGPNFGDTTTTSESPFETGNSQPPIAAETTTATVESKTPEVSIPPSLEGYVFLGDEALPESEAKSKVAIHGNNPTEAAAGVRKLMGDLMSGGTHPNQLMYSAGNNPEAAKEHLVTQINGGLLSSVVEGNTKVDSKTALLTTSNISMAELVVGEHNHNIDANQAGQNMYSGGTISEVDLAGAEEVVQEGEYTIVKAKWAVSDYDRSGPNSTKGENVVDKDSYVVSMFLRPGTDGTYTIAKFAATKAQN